MPRGKKVDFTAATARARHIRELYKQLEERLHGSAWTPQEVMLGYPFSHFRPIRPSRGREI